MDALTVSPERVLMYSPACGEGLGIARGGRRAPEGEWQGDGWKRNCAGHRAVRIEWSMCAPHLSGRASATALQPEHSRAAEARGRINSVP